jgi:uncharacterized protein YcfL
MKRMFVPLIIATALLIGCESKTTRVEGPTQTTEVSETSAAGIDTTDTAEAVHQTQTALSTAADAVGEAARNAAEATGTALQEAGKEIEEHAQPGNQK